ncbi:MAG: acyltransferase [Cyanobacteria bacterium P01_H01_bin.74]
MFSIRLNPHPKLKRIVHDLDSMLTAAFLFFTNLLGWSTLVNHWIRPLLLKGFGFKMGSQVALFPGLRIYSRFDDISIDDGTFINQNCFFDASAPVSIGKYCQIGFNVSFITSSHELNSDLKGRRPTLAKPIVVEDFVWICSGVTVLPGVRIGKGSVVAAGALVTSDIPPQTVFGGVPAKKIRALPEKSEEAVHSELEPLMASSTNGVATIIPFHRGEK